jgi:hypothetical protein
VLSCVNANNPPLQQANPPRELVLVSLWVTRTTVRSAARRRRPVKMRCSAFGSRAAVGSSSTRSPAGRWKNSGERDALPLPAGEFLPTPPFVGEQGVRAVAQAVDDLVGTRRVSCGEYGGVPLLGGLSKGDVLPC